MNKYMNEKKLNKLQIKIVICFASFPFVSIYSAPNELVLSSSTKKDSGEPSV